jgi:hypothetical protein
LYAPSWRTPVGARGVGGCGDEACRIVSQTMSGAEASVGGYGGLSRRSMHGVWVDGADKGEVAVHFNRQQQSTIEAVVGDGGSTTPKAGAGAASSPGGGGGGGFLDAVQASRFVFSMSIVIEHSLSNCMGRTGKGIQKFGFLWRGCTS